MQHTRQQRGNIIPVTMMASAFMGLITTFSYFLVSLSTTYTASMELTPTATVVTIGETFTTTVAVEASTPVNAYSGLITFDPTILQVERIDYNTSIADLWAEAPWYENGAGTIQFAGGSTQSGGFTGEGTLLTITFTTLSTGDASVRINDALVLKHDGMGTAAALEAPIDALFTVIPGTHVPTPVTQHETEVTVRPEGIVTDLNNDSRVTMADVSIFFVYLTTNDRRGDVNNDGRVSTTDLSILIGAISL